VDLLNEDISSQTSEDEGLCEMLKQIVTRTIRKKLSRDKIIKPGGTIARPGQLFVSVNDFTGIKEDGWGIYCMISMENQAVRTSTVSSRNAVEEPGVEWNEGFSFDTRSHSGVLTIQVWAKEVKVSFPQGKFLGELRVSIESLGHQQPIDIRYPLEDRNGNLMKELLLRTKLHYTSCSQSVSMKDFELLAVLGKGTYGKVMQVKKEIQAVCLQ